MCAVRHAALHAHGQHIVWQAFLIAIFSVRCLGAACQPYPLDSMLAATMRLLTGRHAIAAHPSHLRLGHIFSRRSFGRRQMKTVSPDSSGIA